MDSGGVGRALKTRGPAPESVASVEQRLLSELSEAQRSHAANRFAVLRRHLENGVPLAQVSREHKIPRRTLYRWLEAYHTLGLAGLVRKSRDDRGRRSLPIELEHVIEGFALRRPPMSRAAVYRETTAVARAQGWPEPSYGTVYDVIRHLPNALLTLAHHGPKVYADRFELLYRREARRPNEMWQADHTPLDLWVLDEHNRPARPWFTIVLDDYSRAVAGFALSLHAPSSIQTALALRQAIWRKGDPHWSVCGISETFYTDHGSDFTSHHLEQVAADLHMAVVFSIAGKPRGRGKVERIFGTVNQLFLCHQPGYTPPGSAPAKPVLTLPELDARMRAFLVETYHHQPHSETGVPPHARWEADGFLPRLPDSLEQLDLLLLTVAKPRRVHPDGIHFQGFRYLDTTLAAYVGEDVIIRYDPRDMAELRVYFGETFLCRAINPELAGETIGLKDIIRARNQRRRELRTTLAEREATIEALLRLRRGEELRPEPESLFPEPESASTKPSARLTSEELLQRVTAAEPPTPQIDFIVTKEYRRFAEFCEACREARYIGLCYGLPGVGKTVSARQYAHWHQLESLMGGPPPYRHRATPPRDSGPWRTVLFTPGVTNTPRTVEHAVSNLWGTVDGLGARATWYGDPDAAVARQPPDLLVVDEADRLKTASLEQVRDFYDRRGVGVVLIGMPGLQKRLARYAQLYSRVGFVHQFRPLSGQELQAVIEHQWVQLGLDTALYEHTDAAVVNTIARVTGGNFRLVQRLFAQIERIVTINNLPTVTTEVVTLARERLVDGPA